MQGIKNKTYVPYIIHMNSLVGNVKERKYQFVTKLAFHVEVRLTHSTERQMLLYSLTLFLFYYKCMS